MKCPTCMEDNDIDSPFCNYCGAQLELPEKAKTTPNREKVVHAPASPSSAPKQPVAKPQIRIEEREPEPPTAIAVPVTPRPPSQFHSQPIVQRSKVSQTLTGIVLIGLMIAVGVMIGTSANNSADEYTEEVQSPFEQIETSQDDRSGEAENRSTEVIPDVKPDTPEVSALTIDRFEIASQTDTPFGSYIRLVASGTDVNRYLFFRDGKFEFEDDVDFEEVYFITSPTTLKLTVIDANGTELSKELEVSGGSEIGVHRPDDDTPMIEIEAFISASDYCDFDSVRMSDDDPLRAYLAKALRDADYDLLVIYRHAILAYYGLRMESELRAVFSERNWYEPFRDDPNEILGELTARQRANIEFLMEQERKFIE